MHRVIAVVLTLASVAPLTTRDALAVLSGGRILTLQMSVPQGRTPASIQPNIVALAKAILPKLK